MNHFHVKQEVVCIRADHDPSQATSLSSGLVEGKIYVIRWMGIYGHYLDGEYLGIRVEGINRGICKEWGYNDPPFFADRFRPLVNDPLAELRQIAADPNGYRPAAPEGPLHPTGPLPDDGEGVKEREKEEV